MSEPKRQQPVAWTWTNPQACTAGSPQHPSNRAKHEHGKRGCMCKKKKALQVKREGAEKSGLDKPLGTRQITAQINTRQINLKLMFSSVV